MFIYVKFVVFWKECARLPLENRVENVKISDFATQKKCSKKVAGVRSVFHMEGETIFLPNWVKIFGFPLPKTLKWIVWKWFQLIPVEGTICIPLEIIQILP